MAVSWGDTSKTEANVSGRTVPIWYRKPGDSARTHFPRLGRDARADVCIVGAGIAGLMSAYLLAKAGKSVIVLDEKPIGGGETGRTSAHLASAIDDRFLEIEKNRGVEAAMVQYESHAAGIDLIERIVSEHRIDCDFSRVDGYLFAGEGHDREFLERECDAARRAGCADAGLLDRAPVTGFASGACVRFPRQGRFHPLRYLIGLADVLRAMGVRIHCGARVCDLAGDGPVIAKVDGGPVVRADFGIAATNVPTPINNWMGIYTKQASYRSYVIAMEVARGAVSDALYWDTLDPYHYVRVVDSDDAEHKSLLIVGGEDHRVGTHGTLDEGIQCFERLERWARERFCRGLGDDAGLGRVVARWSGQVAEPDDGVAFIGRVPTRTHQACFVITGDSGMGLTGGALGAILVSELILKGGGEKADRDVHPWAGLYDPARKPTTSLQGAVEFVKENAAAAATMVEYLTPGDVDSVEKIAPGTGAVVRDGMSKVAAYRDEEGTLHRCSAICPHLKCIVQWNGLEKSWDCPCHGSRFDAKGKLIMGPAIDNLPVIENEK